MQSTLKMPTYKELIELSDAELTECIALALTEIDNAEERGQPTAEKMKIYQAYKNELARRNYAQRARW
jgi:hypothetical protein